MKTSVRIMGMPAFVVAVVLFAGCRSRAQSTTEPPRTPVRVAEALRSEQAIEVRTVGTLSPSTVVPLSFKIGGPVAVVLVDIGDEVNKGQLLATLHTDEIDAAVRQTESALAKAMRDAERMRSLYADSVVTLAQMQDAETGLEVARALASAAAFNRAYAEIRAPMSGRILARSIEQGQIISSGTRAFRLGVQGGWSVFASVADIDVVNLAVGDRAVLEFDAFQGESLQGLITELGETPDPRTGTYEIEIAVSPSGQRLRAGYVARVRLYPSTTESYTIIPAAALVRAEGKTGIVFVVKPDGQTAEERSVVIAGLMESSIAVQSGLNAGDQVVTDGAGYIFDGAGISIQN